MNSCTSMACKKKDLLQFNQHSSTLHVISTQKQAGESLNSPLLSLFTMNVTITIEKLCTRIRSVQQDRKRLFQEALVSQEIKKKGKKTQEKTSSQHLKLDMASCTITVDDPFIALWCQKGV